MPALFPSGEWTCGLGAIAAGSGSAVYWRRDKAGPACVLDANHVIAQAQTAAGWQIHAFDRLTGAARAVSMSGANSLYAGGQRWAAFLGTSMRYGTIDGVLRTVANAAPVDVDRDGVIGYKPDHQTGVGLALLQRDGISQRISDTLARDVAVVPGRNAAVWARNLGLGVAGMSVVSVQRPTAKPRVPVINGALWLLYQFSLPDTNGDGGRLVLHPVDSLMGYVLEERRTGFRAFRPDAVQLSGTIVLVAYARTEGESVESLVLNPVNLMMPRVDVSKFTAGPSPEPEPMPIPNHLDVVKAARAKYASLSGPERAGRIVNQVAWDLRVEGAGTFYKPSGDNWQQRSLDVLIYKHRDGDPAGKGATFDILGDAEGNANPQWSRTQPSGYGDSDKWRSAVDPGDAPPPDPPGTDPNNIKGRLQDVQRQLTAAQEDLAGIISDL